MTETSQTGHGHLNEVEAIPGTVHLVDSHGSLEGKHAAGADKDVVLVPAPSAHPDDPLNWRPRRKYISAFCMAL